MSADVNAKVEAEIKIKGANESVAETKKLATALKESHQNVAHLTKNLDHLSMSLATGGLSRLGGMADSVMAKIGGIGQALASHAIKGGFHAIKTGISEVNAEIEKAQVSFAGAFNMFGVVRNLGDAMGYSKGLVAQIRKDAAALPGETVEFMKTAQTIAPALAKMNIAPTGPGASIANVNSSLVLAAKGAGMNTSEQLQQAAREFVQGIRGHAGSQNTFLSALGIDTHTMIKNSAGKDVAFNKATDRERFAYLQKNVGEKAQENLPLFAHTWDTQTSTLKDNVKNFLGVLTGPLFDRMRYTLVDLNNWFDNHKTLVTSFATKWGVKLQNGFLVAVDHAKKIPALLEKGHAWVEKMGPRFEHIGRVLTNAYHKLEPLLSKAGHFALKQAENPMGAARGLLGVSLAGKAAGAAPGLVSGLASLSMLRGGAAAVGSSAGAAATTTTTLSGSILGLLGPVTLAIGALGLMAFAVKTNTIAAQNYSQVKNVLGGIIRGIIKPSGTFSGILSTVGTVLTTVVKMALTPFIFGLMRAKGYFMLLKSALYLIGDAINWVIAKIKSLPGVKQAIGAYEWAKNTAAGKAIGNFVGGATTALTGGKGIKNWIATGGFANNILDGAESMFGKPGADDPLGDVDGSVKKQLDDMNREIRDSEFLGRYGRPQETEKPPVVDARGAKIEIKLDAKNEDPDRVVRRMFDAIGKAVANPSAGSTRHSPNH